MVMETSEHVYLLFACNHLQCGQKMNLFKMTTITTTRRENHGPTMSSMEIPVVEFSRREYKIRKVFAKN